MSTCHRSNKNKTNITKWYKCDKVIQKSHNDPVTKVSQNWQDTKNCQFQSKCFKGLERFKCWQWGNKLVGILITWAINFINSYNVILGDQADIGGYRPLGLRTPLCYQDSLDWSIGQKNLAAPYWASCWKIYCTFQSLCRKINWWIFHLLESKIFK